MKSRTIDETRPAGEDQRTLSKQTATSCLDILLSQQKLLKIIFTYLDSSQWNFPSPAGIGLCVWKQAIIVYTEDASAMDATELCSFVHFIVAIFSPG